MFKKTIDKVPSLKHLIFFVVKGKFRIFVKMTIMQKSGENILQKINKLYFWDVDFEKLDYEKSKRLIIERVATLGNLEEFKMIMDLYGKQEIINVLTNINYLDPKTLNFFSVIFKIPKNHFKCYTRKSLTNPPLSS